MELSLTILLTGFAVVFAVLLVLIGVIKLYGTIIFNLQNKTRRNAVIEKSVEREKEPNAPVAESAPVSAAGSQQHDDDLIAVIAAAVYSVCSPEKVRIRSIRRETPASGAWRAAGLRDNTRSF